MPYIKEPHLFKVSAPEIRVLSTAKVLWNDHP